MENDGLETEEQSIVNAVDLLDRLLFVADGDSPISIGQYDASTMIALLMDKPYRVEVMSRLPDFDNADSDD